MSDCAMPLHGGADATGGTAPSSSVGSSGTVARLVGGFGKYAYGKCAPASSAAPAAAMPILSDCRSTSSTHMKSLVRAAIAA